MMGRRELLGTTGCAALVGAAGCLGSMLGDDEPDVAEEDIAETIVLDDREFDPMTVEIEPGEAIEWVNESEEDYELRTNDTYGETDDWDLEADLSPGDSTAHLFEEEGYYAFHEAIHTSLRMCGGVAVGRPEDEMPSLHCE